MVEPAAGAADDDDPSRPQRSRRVERQLEVGRVLVDRVPLEPDAGALELGQAAGADRVEVADGEIDALRRARSAWSAPLSAAITNEAGADDRARTPRDRPARRQRR